jgi:GAF domain-containing protein
MVVGALGTAFGVAVQAYAYDALTGRLGGAPWGHEAVWVAVQSGAVFAVALLAVLFLIAPDGRLLSRRWRPAMALTVLGLLLSWVAVAMVSPSRFDETGVLRGGTPTVVDLLVTLGGGAVAVGLAAGTLSVVLRLRAADGEERAQLRWVAFAAAGLATGVVLAVVLGALGAPSGLSVLPLMVAYLCVPVCTGVAILRFRLYDIDVIVSRAIVLAMLSGMVAAGYVLVVLVTSGLLDAPAEGAFWPSLLATALVALGVQPARRRLNQLADRLVYGAQAAPYEALADFSRGLTERSLDDLVPRVAEAVGRAVSARSVRIAVQVPGRDPEQICWPLSGPSGSRQAADVVLPVRSGELVCGEVAVAMPRGRSLRPGETRLLEDFTVQLGRALANLRLEAELAEQVEELRARARELEASARRLHAAQRAGRDRFESAIRRDVLPHLADLPGRLATLHGAAVRGVAPRPTDLAPLAEGTRHALSALRTLTRGVFPAQLEHRGLVPTLASQLEEAGLAGLAHTVRGQGNGRGNGQGTVDTRGFGARTEGAAYFCAMEFLRELDPPEEVTVSVADDRLALTVSGRASGPVQASTRHLADRVAALDGSLTVTVSAGRASLRVLLPAVSDGGGQPGVEEPVGVER